MGGRHFDCHSWSCNGATPRRQLLHKPSETQLVMNNMDHLPVSDSPTNAQTIGGIEFNWSPGLLGHSVFTEEPVWVARVKVRPRGM
jgi:hypothetical protein